MWKWIVVLALLFAGLPAQMAWADNEVEIEVDIPLSEILKQNQWAKLDVTLTSETQDISGMLQLESDDHANAKSGVLAQAVTLSKGQTKTYQFTLPAVYLMRGPLRIQVVEGNKVLATEKLETVGTSDPRTVVVLDQNRNAFHFMNLLNEGVAYRYDSSWNEAKTVHLSPSELPDDSLMLRHMNILAIGNLAADAIRPAQVEAVKSWVQGGGVLLLSTGDKASGAAANLAEWIQVKKNPGATQNVEELKFLTKQTSSPVTSLGVYNRDESLFVLKKVGRGKVLLANYDVSAEPLASWQYNRDLWSQLATKYQLFTAGNQGVAVNGVLPEFSKLIPGVNLPRVEWLAVIWLVYILVIAPLLYVILKRKDRREWAWGIIPASALVLMIGVYVIGKSMVTDGNSSYSVSEINIIDHKLADVQTAASFLATAGGEYTVHIEKGYTALPIALTSHNTWLTNASTEQNEAGQLTFHYQHVPYLTLRQAIASGEKTDIGSFEAQLNMEGQQVRGTVKNHTSFDLDELFLVMGMQRIPLGAIKKGEEKQVDLTLQPFFAPQEMNRDAVMDRDQLVEISKRDLTTFYGDNSIRLVGLSSQPMPVVTMDLSDTQAHHLQVIKQKITLKDTETKRSVYPFGIHTPYVIAQEGEAYPLHTGQWQIGRGSVTFGLAVSDDQVEAQKLEIPLEASSYLLFKKELFHASSNQWIEVPNEKAHIVLEGAELKQYLTSAGHLRLRITNSSDQRLNVPEPSFRLEGEEK
ncbi:hypothetical protein [Brevibacillus dissolubilis]|uniref:hypothetical protein n=1 Tax=Brevibacillus dissolubilis TaxID=1844116 RepID=UPI0011160FF0|nr:hypothetical protein [Brevibacillus dissolubilis]